MVELKQDDSIRPWIVISFALFILASAPVWWGTVYNYGRQKTPFIRELDLDKNRIVLLNYIAVHDNIQFKGIQRTFSRIDLGYDSIDQHPEAQHLPTSGSFSKFLELFKTIQEPEIGIYNVYVIEQESMDWTDYIGTINDLNLCSRNQLVVLDRSDNLDRLQVFQNKMAAELSLSMPDAIFGLDMELPIRFTLLSIGDTPVQPEAFKKDLEENMRPIIEQLRTVFPVKVTCQTRLEQSFSEPPSTDEKSTLHYFSETQLSTLMRSSAWNLELTTKNTSSVHFVVIFDQKSIHVRDAQGSLSKSFLYPDWGGAYFWDPRGNNEPAKYFASNLLHVLGLDYTTTCGCIKPFDLDRLLLTLLQSNVQRIATARTAYSELLAKSSFIEIPEDLGKLLGKWARTTETTQRALDEGALGLAVRLSAKTAQQAEDAFYHPSLMGKMYFPDEHKYAVYMPLLLPTLLPIVIGLLKVTSTAIRNRRRV